MPRLLLALIFIGLSMAFAFSKKSNENYSENYQSTVDSLKNDAFVVLENNCNECHIKKKPTYVFTPENMSLFAPIINVQVFVKHKMPKGKKNVLTETDASTLKAWINYELAQKKN